MVRDDPLLITHYVSRITFHVSRITFHASRITFHVSRFTHRASRKTMTRTCSLSDDQRFPLLTADGRRLLERLWEHPAAPRYNFRCGDQLTDESLARVRAYEQDLKTAQNRWA